MGIEGYQPWQSEQFSSSVGYTIDDVTSGKPKEVRNLFIDYNAIVHNAINAVYDTPDPIELQAMYETPETYWLSAGGVLDTLVNELVDLLRVVKPRKLMYLGADGVVMKAKLLQQRQRSFAVPPRVVYETNDPKKAEITAIKNEYGREPFNRNNVKPGTEFMLTMSHELKKRIEVMGWEHVEGFPEVVEFSDATQPGEGEHKIMERMKEPRKGSERDHMKYIDVIYSADSDMSLLTMLHADPKMTVLVMRQTHSFKYTEEEVKPDKLPINEKIRRGEYNVKYEFYNVTEIRRTLIASGFTNIRDFVMITCFAGNDFMPGLAFTKRERTKVFNILVSTYLNEFKGRSNPSGNLYQDGGVNWGNLARYLSRLAQRSKPFLESLAVWQNANETRLYSEETGDDRRWKALSRSYAEGAFDTVFFSEQYRRFVGGIFANPDTLEGLTPDAELDSELRFDVSSQMARKYLEAIAWVMSYYETQGRDVNSDWCYNFHYAPDIYELDRYLSRYHSTPTWLREPLAPNHTLNTPVEHLLSILRAEDLDLVPKIAKVLFLAKMPSLFPESIQIDSTLIPLDDKSVGHKSVVLINYPSLPKIRRLFASIEDDENVKARNGKTTKVKIWPTGRKAPKKYQ